MAWNCKKAAETYDVQYCIYYAVGGKFIFDYFQGKPFLLIERVDYVVPEQLQQRFGISWLRLKLSKPKAVAQASNVGIIVERGELK